MENDRELDREALKGLLASLRDVSQEELRRRGAERDAMEKRVIDAILDRTLGVRSEYGNTIYTQHPLMAGVLRQAMREAYRQGVADVMMGMLTISKRS